MDRYTAGYSAGYKAGRRKSVANIIKILVEHGVKEGSELLKIIEDATYKDIR